MARYSFSQKLTIEDLLKEIGRSDIPSPEVSMEFSGDRIVIDFGGRELTPLVEAKLKTMFSNRGYPRFLGKDLLPGRG